MVLVIRLELLWKFIFVLNMDYRGLRHDLKTLYSEIMDIMDDMLEINNRFSSILHAIDHIIRDVSALVSLIVLNLKLLNV